MMLVGFLGGAISDMSVGWEQIFTARSVRVTLSKHIEKHEHENVADTLLPPTMVLHPTVGLVVHLLHISQLRSSTSCTIGVLVTRLCFMIRV
jgi:hypothetical protein